MAWFALLAEFSTDPVGADQRSADRANTDRRSTGRRKLAFGARLTTAQPGSHVIVLDLSRDGLMLHAQDDLAVGEVFEVAMPGADAVEARVVWKRTTLYGCKFGSPVSRGTVSAILLKARPKRSLATEC
jgi:hypothetical protein